MTYGFVATKVAIYSYRLHAIMAWISNYIQYYRMSWKLIIHVLPVMMLKHMVMRFGHGWVNTSHSLSIYFIFVSKKSPLKRAIRVVHMWHWEYIPPVTQLYNLDSSWNMVQYTGAILSPWPLCTPINLSRICFGKYKMNYSDSLPASHALEQWEKTSLNIDRVGFYKGYLEAWNTSAHEETICCGACEPGPTFCLLLGVKRARSLQANLWDVLPYICKGCISLTLILFTETTTDLI